VIAAPVGGIPELIEDGVNGHLVKPSDHAEIERIIKSWLEHPARFLELRRSSRFKAERDFDGQRMVNRYAAVFAGASQSIQHPNPVLTK
jgi:glycosyltransferase involved in cell wall biosynthesis